MTEPLDQKTAADQNDTTAPKSPPTRKPKQENMWLNILLNIVIPTLILTKLSGETFMGHPWGLGATWGLVVALAFPLLYGLHDYIDRRKFNVFSALGIISVLMTGGISLLKLDTGYYLLKEALLPSIIGLIILGSTKTRSPLVKVLFYNDTLLKVEKISSILKERNLEKEFDKRLLMVTWIIAASYFVCGALNYFLAKAIVVSPSGTEQFNIEVGKMHYMGFIVLLVPSIGMLAAALYYLFRSIKQLTGLTMEEVMHEDSSSQEKDSSTQDKEEK